MDDEHENLAVGVDLATGSSRTVMAIHEYGGLRTAAVVPKRGFRMEVEGLGQIRLDGMGGIASMPIIPAEGITLRKTLAPKDARSMSKFMDTLMPKPAKKLTPRQRRSEARRARHAARPPVKGYWAKRQSKTWTMRLAVTKVEPNGDLLCQPTEARGGWVWRGSIRFVKRRGGMELDSRQKDFGVVKPPPCESFGRPLGTVTGKTP